MPSRRSGSPRPTRRRAATAPPATPSTPAAAFAFFRPRLRKALRDVFGLDGLREGQADVIAHVLAGRPTLAVMPTGAGKSLCYQLPAVLLPGVTLVVSPLIALMKDQCDKLRQRGVPAHELNSAVDADAVEAAGQAIRDGRARVVCTTPERLADPSFASLFDGRSVSLLVVDEAHCISQWGHDFRPAFLEIGSARRRLGNPPLLALTATATDAVAADIAAQLGERRMHIVDTGVYRPNLRYSVGLVTREDEKLERTVDFVREAEGPGIVYAATIKAAEATHAALAAAGIEAALYHGRLGAGARHARQNDFMDGRVRVMVATPAFGLGIDKPDVRFVLHVQIPAGLDAYYQESGRAGRDGEPAHCHLLYQREDRAVQRFFLAGRYPTPDDVDALREVLAAPSADGAPWTLPRLAERLARPRARLQVALTLLRRNGVAVRDAGGGWSLGDGDAGAARRLVDDYRLRREHDADTLERMTFYAQTGRCRWRVLLEHFGAADGFDRCERCDNCCRVVSRATVEEPPAEPAPSRRFAVGDPVRVPRYGPGVVEDWSAEGVAVRLADGAVRMFVEAFVKAARPARKKLPQTLSVS